MSVPKVFYGIFFGFVYQIDFEPLCLPCVPLCPLWLRFQTRDHRPNIGEHGETLPIRLMNARRRFLLRGRDHLLGSRTKIAIGTIGAVISRLCGKPSLFDSARRFLHAHFCYMQLLLVRWCADWHVV